MKPLPESDVAVPIPMLLPAPLAVDVTPAPARPRSLPGPLLPLASDERLARLASAGDRAAFGAIFHRYHQELYRFCVSILRNPDDAGDALQSTMLRALKALEGEQREIALRPWLYRIAHNESITLLRRREAAAIDAELAMPSRLDVEATADVRAELEQLLGDLRHLPERQRAALIMRELAGLTYAEIAAVIDTTAAGAKQATYDARRALHELANGREMDCTAVCNTVSAGDGRAMRSRAFRAHLRACGDCRDYRDAIVERQSKAAALLPLLPPAAATDVLEGVFASAGGSAGGGGLLTVFGGPATAKSRTALALATVSATGVLSAVESRTGRDGAGGSASGGASAPILHSRTPGVAAHHRAHHGSASKHAGRAHSASGTRTRAMRRGDAGGGVPGPEPASYGRATATGVPKAAPAASPPMAPADPRRRGPLQHVVPGAAGNHPIRAEVGAVQDQVGAVRQHLPDLPAAQDASPVKPPPVPGHPKRKRNAG
jgi:RNA polymerase sigma factor (sigma-70 family)